MQEYAWQGLLDAIYIHLAEPRLSSLVTYLPRLVAEGLLEDNDHDLLRLGPRLRGVTGQRVATRQGATVTWLHGDGPSLRSGRRQVAGSDARYTPFGEYRTGLAGAAGHGVSAR